MGTNDTTTIQVSRTTKERLEDRGIKGDTFEDIISDLLDQTEDAA